jgi:RNA polymerase sigma factor (sigma-70 family)
VPADVQLAELLADVAWLRLLARQLAGGADGDDLAQDTVMVALGKSRPEGAGLRPWLVVTARNLWRRRRRDESRRRARHAALEEPEPAVSAEATLERLDTLAAVAELVRRLPDPYRATVLARYLDSKSAVEIAAETGVPAGTVRWRLKEALERLRAAMDERHGGDRRRWALLVLPAPRGRPMPGKPVALPAAVMVGLATVAVPGAVLLPLGARAHRSPAGNEPAAALPRSPGLQPMLLSLELPASEANGAVAGVIRDPAGRPVAGAAVVSFPTRETSMATDPSLADRLEGRTLTDAGGRFALEGRLPGSYLLAATHERFGPAEATIPIGTNERRRADLWLSTGGELLSGTIQDAGAGPVVGARVTAVEFPGRGPQLRYGTISGAGGRYAMRLPRGHWHVSALADGYAYGWREVVLEGPSALDLALPAAGAIGGRVVDGSSGAPVAGATVRLDRAGGSAGRATTTGAEGFFSFGTAWPTGGYRLTATAGDRVGRLEVAAPVDPVVRSPVEVTVRPGLTLAGRVLDRRGQPLAGAAVQLFDGSRQIHPVRQVTTDGDGRYRMAGLLPGQAWLGAEARGRAPARRPLVLATTGAALDFGLEDEATVTGVLTSDGGIPVSRAELQLTLLGGEPGSPLLAFRRVQTSPQGAFRVDGLAAGAFIVDVQSRQEGSGRFQGSLLPAEHRRVNWRVQGPWSPDGRGRDALVVGPF